MKFSVGYSARETDSFVREIIRLSESIAEVYFSLPGMPSGRSRGSFGFFASERESAGRMLCDLAKMADAGLKFNLLFNANCYGAMAESRALFSEVGEGIDFVREKFGLSSVTTASPLIAKFVKQNFSGLDVRASVNMSIGSPEGMDYVSDYYDSFYIKRELNRDIGAVRELVKMAEDRGKRLYILANSGCLNNCSAHTFHDNLVAHEREAAMMDNGYQFTGVCREYLSKNASGEGFIALTNFIRPEDTHYYDGLVGAMKLATRVHPSPERVLRAYVERGRFSGNAAGLLEPDHSGILYPYVIDNSVLSSEVREDKLIINHASEAFIRLEENYAYQQNDQGSCV